MPKNTNKTKNATNFDLTSFLNSEMLNYFSKN